MAHTDLTIDNAVASAQNLDSQVDINELSAEETKQFLTPFAFEMDKSLFGLPLASPTKRAFALLIDLGLIALLSGTSGGVLALAIAITLYRLGNKERAQARGKTSGYKRRTTMRFIAAFILFFILLDTLPPLLTFVGIESKNAVIKDEESPILLDGSIVLAGYALSTISTLVESECEQLECWQKELEPVARNMAKINLKDNVDNNPASVVSVFTKISAETELDLAEQVQLNEFMLTAYQQELSEFQHEKPTEQVSDLSTENHKVTESNTNQAIANKPIYSVIELIKGIINDLGLGFGWATFYFTVFIALSHGQTLGKKVVGIKVLQLDGTPLSLWDSFERYGGYGAGIATGLLGFIQIYWDPNRQAIHDKISSTVVIDIKKARLINNKP